MPFERCMALRLRSGVGAARAHFEYENRSHRDFQTTVQETRGGETEPISRFYKLSANGVSNTLRAGTDAARGAFTSPRPIHYRYARDLTVREMARLHGFPDWFRFQHTKWHGARQIGNAVPAAGAGGWACSHVCIGA